MGKRTLVRRAAYTLCSFAFILTACGQAQAYTEPVYFDNLEPVAQEQTEVKDTWTQDELKELDEAEAYAKQAKASDGSLITKLLDAVNDAKDSVDADSSQREQLLSKVRVALAAVKESEKHVQTPVKIEEKKEETETNEPQQKQVVNDNEQQQVVNTNRVKDIDASIGEEIARAATMMAATATPMNERIQAPWGNPWADNGDPRIDNLVAVMDATIGSVRGNDAYGSCHQAAFGVISAVADMGAATASATANPAAGQEYVNAHPETYEFVGTNLGIADLRPGDLMFCTRNGWFHTMIYVGNDIAKERFPNTDANVYEASFSDSGRSLYAGLTKWDDQNLRRFDVYRVKNKPNVKVNWRDLVH